MKYVDKIIRRFCKSWYFSSHKSSYKVVIKNIRKLYTPYKSYKKYGTQISVLHYTQNSPKGRTRAKF